MVKANKLSQLQASRVKQAGLYGDGAGLWLKVTAGGSKSWVLRYPFEGRERWAGLGSYPEVPLAEARENAMAFRKRIREGGDPVREKRSVKLDACAVKAQTVTFDWCAEQYIDSHRSGWKNLKHAEQWISTIASYVSPVIGKLAVSDVETVHVMKILQPIWHEKTETASRLRGRIESVLDWAGVHQYRNGENPARWKGHLDALLPAKSKVAKARHFAAIPWREIHPFFISLRGQAGVGALALQFTILTAARSGEVRGMIWDEINFEQRLWIVPAARMKAGREHRVPLSDAAFDLLNDLYSIRLAGVETVFPSVRDHKPLSDMTLTAVLRRMERRDLTVHGFRSTFRDWAAEATEYSQEMAEMALAHTIANKVEAAYRRGDMLDKRREMMNAWSKYILIEN